MYWRDRKRPNGKAYIQVKEDLKKELHQIINSDSYRSMSTCLLEKVFYTDQLFYTTVFSNYHPENTVLWFKNRDQGKSSFLGSLVHHVYNRIVIFTPSSGEHTQNSEMCYSCFH
jgi:hypothetical protein